MMMIDGWSKVTIRTAERLEAVKGETGMDRDVMTVSILFGIPEEEVWEWDVQKMGEAVAELSWLLEPPVPEMTQHIDYQGRFVPVLDLGRMTYRQYADLNAAIASGDRASVLASMVAPDGGTYGKGYSVSDLTEHIRDTVTIPQYHGFFLSCLTSLLPQGTPSPLSWGTGRTMKRVTESGPIRDGSAH